MEGYISYSAARETQADALESAIPRLSAEIVAQQAGGRFAGPGPIFVGIGASLAAAAAPVWELRARGIHSWRLSAGEQPLPFPASMNPIIGISQSGKSTETLAVLESIDRQLRYAVVNTSPSPVADCAIDSLSLGSIPDSYASTIGFTATVVALGMIADAWDGGTIDDGWSKVPELVHWVESTVGERAPELATGLAAAPSADFVGAGPSVGSAEAGALLFREIARIPSTGMGTRQYLHGSMESAGDGVHVLFGDGREIEVAHTLSNAGHRVVLVSSESIEQNAYLQTIRLPRIAASQRAVLEAVVLQILVGETANIKGIDIEEFVFYNSDTKVSAAGGNRSQ
jgi:fructoselysine-6-P-deglycase FrlB-like protein